jgi:hypothetical protein
VHGPLRAGNMVTGGSNDGCRQHARDTTFLEVRQEAMMYIK